MSSHPFDSADAVAELSALYELSFLRYSGSMTDFAGEALEKALRLFGVRRFALWVGPPDARSIYLLSGLRDEQSALSLARLDEPNRFVEALGADGALGLLLMEQASAIAPKERRFYNIYARSVEDGLLAAKGKQERQETLEALALSEERHRMLFQQSKDAIFIGAPDGRVIDVNQAWLDLSGYERDDLPGFEAIDLYANPEDREQFVHRMAETGHVQDEVRFRKKDGTVFDCQRTVVVLKDESGAVVAYQGIMRDITERKRAEAALRESEEKYRTLFQLSRDATYLVKPDGTFIEVNQAWLDILGCSPEDVAKFDAAHWYANPDDRAVFRERLSATGDVLDDEVQLRRKDGTVFDCQRRNVAQLDEHGNIRAFQGVMRDVTEMRNAERALRKSEEEYRSLFEQSMDPTMLVEVDGSNIRANQAWLNLFGYSREELPKLNIVQVYANPDDRKDFLRRIAQTGAVEDEVLFKKKDGTVFDCQRRVVARRDEHGNIRAFQGVMRDVTEIRNAERALRKSEEEYRSLFEQSIDPILVAGVDGSNVRANQAWLDLFGYSREELPKLNMLQFYANPDDRKDFLRRITEAGLVEDEVRFKKKDGTVMECQRATAARKDERGNVVAYQGIIRDITEQKRAQQALKDSEEKYRSLFEQSTDAVALVAVDGTLLDANPAYLRLYGLDGGAIDHSNVRDRYVEVADRDEFLRRMEQYGAVRDDDVRLKKVDGTVMDCLRTAIAIRDETGRIVAFQSVVRDITEQKRAQQALKDSEEKYRTLFEQSMDAVALVAADGTLLDANPAYLRLFGFDAGAIGHSNVQDRYVEAADRAEFLQWMEEHGAIHDEELRHTKADGTVMHCLRSSVATRDETGRIVRFQTVVRDVTEQKRAQQALKDSEEKYRTLFEQSTEVIYICTPQGDAIDANPAWLNLFGYSREELKGFKTIDLYADPEDRDDFLLRIAETGFVEDEVRFKKKDGSVIVCVRTAVARKDQRGNIVSYQSTAHDITERKRMEQQLVEANRELRELTARLETAHEEERAEVAWELHDHVAQSLSVLKLDVDSCRSKLAGKALTSLAPTMDGMTHLLDETIGRLRRLYADLVPVMLEDLGLAAAIEWQTEEFTRVSGVECELRRVEDIKLPRGRVPLGMFRVLQEALDNVRRHSGATKVTMDFERDGGDAVLRVADNGRGFTRDEMRKSGALGLAGIRERAQSWGGRVTIESSVGAGTVLKVTAPLEDEPAVRTAPESPDI